MEPVGGSAAAAPEVAPPAATKESTLYPHDAALVTATVQNDEKELTTTKEPVTNDIDALPVLQSEPQLEQLQESPPASQPATQPASQPCPESALQSELRDAALEATSLSCLPPATQVVSEEASQPNTQRSPQTTPEVVTQSPVNEEPVNASLSAATEALSNSLLESIQNALKRPRTGVDDDNCEAEQPGDAKRVKLEAGHQPVVANSIISLSMSPAPTQAPALIPSPSPAPAQSPALVPTPSPVPSSDLAPSAALSTVANIPPAVKVEPPLEIPPVMDLEAMLKSALDSMNHSFSPPQAAPATPTPSPLRAPFAATTPVQASTPAYSSKPAPSSSIPPLVSTPAIVSPSTALIAPASAALSPRTRKAPTNYIPTVDLTGSRRETVSPAANSDLATDQAVRAPSNESRKMRFSRHPTYISRSMGLPLLGSFAVQVLYILGENPGPNSAQNGVATESDLRGVYKALRDAFRNTRHLFSESAILNNEELEIKEVGDQETIFMANMASIASSIFEADDLTLVEAHDHFLSSFLPEPDALNKELAALFLNLKYCTLGVELAKLSPDDRECRVFLERLFPLNLEEQLQSMHADTPLTDYEQRFMWDMRVAREQLFETAKKTDLRQVLQERYTRDGLRKELSVYLRANEDFVLRYADSHGIEIPNDDEIPGDDSDIFGDANQSLVNGTDFAAMGDSIASMLSAAMASSEDLLRPVLASAPAPALESPSGPQVSNTTAMEIDSVPGNSSNRQALETLPMAEGVGKLIQEAIQRSAVGATPQPAPAQKFTVSPAKTASLLSTPSVRVHTTAPPPPSGTSAARSSLTDSVMDLTGLTNLIKEKLGQDAHNAQAVASPAPTPASAPAPVPTQTQARAQAQTPGLGVTRAPAPAPIAPAYKSRQAPSPVAQANAALTSMQNTFANNLAMYSRGPSYIFQPLPPPPVPTPPLHPINNNANRNGLPPNQSLPSAVLYQQARHAAASKTQSHIRREGLHSTRRPWSPDEEQALMAGLDMVKGPHWSQILQLFGANGTISDILRDRSQVQLKDKARNLKLFFLKASTEMPYYLQCVTGELKTRAPSQAARKEAEERARATNQEEQARVQGIMTLAGGLQDNKSQAEAVAAAPATADADAGQPPNGVPPSTPGATNGNVTATTNGNLKIQGFASTSPNSVAAVGKALVSAPSTPNITANTAVQTPPAPRIANANQPTPAGQLQLPQLPQRHVQQTQTPQLAPSANLNTTGTAGAGTASTPVKLAPANAPDVALSAAEQGHSIATKVVAAQQSSGPAINRPLAPITLPPRSVSAATPALASVPTSASIRSVSAGITAGMTAAINNAISNAALAARPFSTPLMTTAQRLAAANRAAAAAAAASGKNSSFSPSPQKKQQQYQQHQQQLHRHPQPSPTPARSQASQSPVPVAARPVVQVSPQVAASMLPARQSSAPAQSPHSIRPAASATQSPATLSASGGMSTQRTPSPLQAALSPVIATSLSAPPASTAAPAATIASTAFAPAHATKPPTAPPPATASAGIKVVEKPPVLVAPVASQAANQTFTPAAPSSAVTAANGPTSGASSNALSAAVAPLPVAPAAAPLAAASTTTPGTKVTAASLGSTTPLSVPVSKAPAPTTTLSVPVVKALPALLQPPPKKDQTVDASEESVLRRLLAPSPS